MNTIDIHRHGSGTACGERLPGNRPLRSAGGLRIAHDRAATAYARPSRTGDPSHRVASAASIERRIERLGEGSIMKRIEERIARRIERFVAGAGRFVFGLGIGFALTSVYVIVSSAPDLLSGRPTPADVIRLDPVVVTISAERFAELHGEADAPLKATHVYGGGPRQV
jgi:hypothetical protein